MRLLVAILVFFLLCNELKAQDRRPIKTLTWNIYMLPSSVFWTGQFKRATAIGKILKEENYDIILFQEAFGKKTRKKLRKALEGSYPFEIEPKRNKTTTNSGLWVLSKHEIKNSEHIFFENCLTGDCQSSKGAVLVELDINGKTYQFLNTHVQSNLGKEFDLARAEQFKMIQELLDKNLKKKTPQFILGDMNTAKKSTEEHQGMLDVFNATDGALSVADNTTLSSTAPASWDADGNDLIKKKWRGTSLLLDYALQRNTNFLYKLRRELKTYTQKWSKKHQHLSDHYAISLTILP